MNPDKITERREPAAPTVLVVDDDEQFRAYVCEVLRGEGYRVIDGADGNEGADLYHAERPGLVITNLMMPEKEGLALIGELRDDDAHLPIVAMTGHSGIFGQRYLRAAAAIGATETLNKPFAPEALLEVVARLIAA